MQHHTLTKCLMACLSLIGSQTCRGGDFTQFRGSLGNGVVPDQQIPLAWSADENVAWAVRLPGSGWSQPVVLNGRIYVSAAVNENQPKPANFAGGVRSPQSMGVTLFAKPPEGEIEWTMSCLNAEDGRVLWQKTIRKGAAKFSVHPSNSYATETPVVDQNGVYVYFGAAGIVAGLSHDGDLLWSQDVGVFKTTNSFGTGSSLAIFEGRLFLQNFTEESAVLHCLATGTGQELWRFERDKKATSWSTPVVWRNGQRAELIVSGDNRIDSLNPENGEPNWTAANIKAATACSIGTNLNGLYFGGSDPFSKGPLFAVAPGATGDISPEKTNARFDHCRWLQEKQGPGMASPVCSEQFVYTTDKSILKCFSAATGERLYQTRLPGLKMIAACPLVIGDKLLLLDEDGRACIVRTGKEFEVIGTGQLDDVFWATPAVADGSIYLRGVDKLYCVRSTETVAER